MPSDDTPTAGTGDELFGLPVGEFIAARDGLVRRLKADGAKEDAAAVKALRRPTLAAWAVNQVVRADPATGDRLGTIAHDIERAQRRALSGVRDGSLRQASAARRHLVEELVDRAAAVLVAAGAAPASHLDDVGRTFEAASTDPEVAARVAEGCLSAPIHPRSDFTTVAGLATVTPAPPLDRKSDGDDDSHGHDGAGDADPELVAKRRAAIRELEAATTRAEASSHRARAARQEATALAEHAEAARRAADDAQRIAEEARQTAERAAAAAEDLESRSDQATSAATSAEAQARAEADEAERARSVLDDLG